MHVSISIYAQLLFFLYIVLHTLRLPDFFVEGMSGFCHSNYKNTDLSYII